MTLNLLPLTLASASSFPAVLRSPFRSARYAVAAAPENQAGTSRNTLLVPVARPKFPEGPFGAFGAIPVGFLPPRAYNTRYCGTPLTRTTRGSTVRIPRLFLAWDLIPRNHGSQHGHGLEVEAGKGRIWAFPGCRTAAEVTPFQGTITRFASLIPVPNLRPRRSYRPGSVVFLP